MGFSAYVFVDLTILLVMLVAAGQKNALMLVSYYSERTRKRGARKAPL